MTEITRATCAQFRADLDAAIAAALAPHGLVGALGKITYNPGTDFTVKLTVVQPAADVPVGVAADPQVGEVWLIGGREYTITSIHGADIVGTRQVRGRWEPRPYRIPRQQLTRARRIK